MSLLAGDQNTKEPKNWNEAFVRLIRLLESKDQNERLIVFLDEIQKDVPFTRKSK